jgi:hypothetical protein
MLGEDTDAEHRITEAQKPISTDDATVRTLPSTNGFSIYFEENYTAYTIEQGSKYLSELSDDEFMDRLDKVEPIEQKLTKIANNDPNLSGRFIGVQSFVFKDKATVEIYLKSGNVNRIEKCDIPAIPSYKIEIRIIFFKEGGSVWYDLSEATDVVLPNKDRRVFQVL